MSKLEVVRLFLERSDVDVNSKDGRSRTALSYAVEAGKPEVVRLLLERNEVSILWIPSESEMEISPPDSRATSNASVFILSFELYSTGKPSIYR